MEPQISSPDIRAAEAAGVAALWDSLHHVGLADRKLVVPEVGPVV